jgi:hypothetical protein
VLSPPKGLQLVHVKVEIERAVCLALVEGARRDSEWMKDLKSRVEMVVQLE